MPKAKSVPVFERYCKAHAIQIGKPRRNIVSAVLGRLHKCLLRAEAERGSGYAAPGVTDPCGAPTPPQESKEGQCPPSLLVPVTYVLLDGSGNQFLCDGA